MLKKSLSAVCALVFGIGLAVAVSAQDAKKTEVIKNPDGTYTVIEYPVGKEVVLTLTPTTALAGAKGMAHVMRSTDGTKVVVNYTGITGDISKMYVYAVDPSGNPTLLGPIGITNGVAKAEFTTPLNQFMIVTSPNELTTYDTSSAVIFRSEVPAGYAIVPRVRTGDSNAVAVAGVAMTKYDVPLLNVPSFKGDTEVRVKFDGDLEGLDGKAYINPKGGKTTVKMRFGDMKKVPQNKRFVLWARGADGSYTKLGQVVNTGARDEGEIRSETALKDFGLFLTVEDAEVTVPTSTIYSVFTIPATP
jgi:hypothetical protein